MSETELQPQLLELTNLPGIIIATSALHENPDHYPQQLISTDEDDIGYKPAEPYINSYIFIRFPDVYRIKDITIRRNDLLSENGLISISVDENHIPPHEIVLKPVSEDPLTVIDYSALNYGVYGQSLKIIRYDNFDITLSNIKIRGIKY